ncbi:hypothetical protein Deiofobo_0391 [Pseudomonas phage Deifobo]|nr:hypothetical protein Deiofobo_0391 [Pseudomonas phage Deifobo]
MGLLFLAQRAGRHLGAFFAVGQDEQDCLFHCPGDPDRAEHAFLFEDDVLAVDVGVDLRRPGALGFGLVERFAAAYFDAVQQQGLPVPFQVAANQFDCGLLDGNGCFGHDLELLAVFGFVYEALFACFMCVVYADLATMYN